MNIKKTIAIAGLLLLVGGAAYVAGRSEPKQPPGITDYNPEQLGIDMAHVEKYCGQSGDDDSMKCMTSGLEFMRHADEGGPGLHCTSHADESGNVRTWCH